MTLPMDKKRPPASALVPAHLAAAGACGVAIAVFALGRDIWANMIACDAECGRPFADGLLTQLLGTVLLAGSAAGFALAFMLPATILLSPLALFVTRRMRTKAAIVAAGAVAGFVVGLPVTILTFSLWDTNRPGVAELVTVYLKSLPDYGVAASVAGATFATVLAANR